ncbi:MAG: phage tail sheath family protein [Desulfatitalea sp.]|nr:phage tail sheath family protein [Desulfatitalea sp.]NNK00621.1 phage tail sheath family protein [Desulfatitalea sp.]
MGQMKTPGVYIVEKSAFPNSVVEVATAVPAFIGYTQTALNVSKSLANKPWRISSMAEYHNYFGFAPFPTFSIMGNAPVKDSGSKKEKAPKDAPKEAAKEEAAPESPSPKAAGIAEEADFTLNGTDYVLNQDGGAYYLYYSMRLFFQNGGGPCYIVSVGNYEDDIDPDRLKSGIAQLIKEQEPTMVVIPDNMVLAARNSDGSFDISKCINVQQAALQHCGGKMRNRVAILDIPAGYKGRQDPSGDCIDNFRSALGINYLDFAAAYYPWINTSIVQESDLSFENFSNPDELQKILRLELKLADTATDDMPVKSAQQIEAVNSITKDWSGQPEEDAQSHKMLLNKILSQMSPLFTIMVKEMKNKLNLLPPSGAMAGIYTMVDNSRGVWKAPANVSINAVVSPAVNITHDDQEDLNVTTQGKSINAIRPFIGEGTLVWGARTLDGNSQDWRYVNVRRTMIMLEESIRLATKAYVFENNVANTWVTIKSMISNFLTGIWKRGGLAGASAEDAFSVHVGLGETMTPNDILDGILRVTVLVALIRPAEFIEITFQQQMQKS